MSKKVEVSSLRLDDNAQKFQVHCVECSSCGPVAESEKLVKDLWDESWHDIRRRAKLHEHGPLETGVFFVPSSVEISLDK
jgi:hypothetical protein